MSFLKAEWRKLVMVNYEVSPELLKSYVPGGTELDFFRGKCYVSLVGFMFQNTKLLGIKVPFHVSFEEVNLRFYVRRKEGAHWKRGVVFIKEMVPKPAITFVANTIYKEHYETVRMSHQWLNSGDHLDVRYSWKKQGQPQYMQVSVQNTPIPMAVGSEEQFIAEHYWGYSKGPNNLTVEYEVKHPSWQVYPIKSHEVKVDFELNYGVHFGDLNMVKPASVLLAEGSVISVENKQVIS